MDISNPDVANRPGSCGIAIMAKASAPGRTKTRLVPPLDAEQAAAINTAFLQDMAANLMAAGSRASDRGLRGVRANGLRGFFSSILPPTIGLIEASLPNLGECLLHTIKEIFSRGHTAAVVLNSDSPTLPTDLLVETARALALPGERAVLGPSDDGGYYLLGLKTAHPRLFEDISWSTEAVAVQTQNGRAKSDWACTCCRCGTTSTICRVCAGCTVI